MMYQVLALLYRTKNGTEEFRSYEHKAMRLIESHGGTLVSGFVPEKNGDPDSPDEIHLLQFPSKRAFEEYRDDPATRKLAVERRRVIARTVTFSSDELVDYSNEDA